jgi:phospholipid/cholesterol/gamma-HCH transport system ATP-binding protein
MECGTGGSAALEIRVDNVQKSFGDNHVLRGINLSVERGEMIAIVGNSGCGKTVLLENMIGHMRPEHGRIWLADHESAGSPLVDLSTLGEPGMDRLRNHWAVVFQGNALLSGTAEESISLPLLLVKGFDENETKLRVRRAVVEVGLNPDAILALKRDQLSGGTAKRVAIARALAMEPVLVFFDEPTTGLDPESSQLIQDLIAKTYQTVQDGYHRTTLIITHDKDLLYRLRPRVVMLQEGMVVFDGSYPSFAQSESPSIHPYFELMPAFNDSLH